MKHIEKSDMCILREVSVKFLKDFAIWISCKRLRFLLLFFLMNVLIMTLIIKLHRKEFIVLWQDLLYL